MSLGRARPAFERDAAWIEAAHRFVRACVRARVGPVEIVCLETENGPRPHVLATVGRDLDAATARAVLGRDHPGGTAIAFPLTDRGPMSGEWSEVAWWIVRLPGVWDEHGGAIPPEGLLEEGALESVRRRGAVPILMDRGGGSVVVRPLRVGTDVGLREARRSHPGVRPGDTALALVDQDDPDVAEALVGLLVDRSPRRLSPRAQLVLAEVPWVHVRWARLGWSWHDVARRMSPLEAYSALIAAAADHQGTPTADRLRRVNLADYFITNGGYRYLIRESPLISGNLERMLSLADDQAWFGLDASPRRREQPGGRIAAGCAASPAWVDGRNPSVCITRRICARASPAGSRITPTTWWTGFPRTCLHPTGQRSLPRRTTSARSVAGGAWRSEASTIPGPRARHGRSS